MIPLSLKYSNDFAVNDIRCDKTVCSRLNALFNINRNDFFVSFIFKV